MDSGLDGHGIWGMAPEANQLVRNHTLGGFKDGVYRLTDLAVKIIS